MRDIRTNNITSLALGTVLILAGILFLVGQFVGASFWGVAWPFTILIPGLLLFVGMVAGGKSAGGLAIPASIITTLGLLMLFQNTFNYFESWSYAWALIPTAVGVGIMINGLWSDQPDLVDKGQNTARVGVVMLIIGFVFFEFVIRIGHWGGGFLGGVAGPLILIAIGGYLLFRNLVEISNEPLPRVTSTPTITSAQASQSATVHTEKAAPESTEILPVPSQESSSFQVTTPPIQGQEQDKITVL